MSRRILAVLLLALLPGACGYFNSLYNAQRRFHDGERATRRGLPAEAARAYQDAVNKAAVSYRKHPDGRWSDDALLLVGRARFAMGEHAAARAALSRVLEQSSDRDVRTTAAIYLGASLVRLKQPDSAVTWLAQGLSAADSGSELHALGRLWLGRAELDLGRADGWGHLQFTADRDGYLAADALLELAARGLAVTDSSRTLGALAVLTRNRAAEPRLDSTMVLAREASLAWGAASVAAILPGIDIPGWRADARSRVALERAVFLAEAGDTANALVEAEAAAEHTSGMVAGQAREAAAGWLLASADGVEDLPQVRAILLPAVTEASALQQVRRVRTLDVLLDLAREGQPAALFAAAEFARDTLGSPRLARQLFLTYADVAAGTVWAPKALLAAFPLSTPAEQSELTQRILAFADNPYVGSVTGEADADAFYTAEQRLGGAIAAVRADAATAALTGDLRVGRAVAVLDSLRELARTDSVRLRCGELLDSLTLRGIRGDSVRAACLRSDTAGVTRFLAIDTTLLRDSVAARGGRNRVVGDTISRS